MLIFLYGPDSYRRQKKQQWIVDGYRKKHPLVTIERFDLEEEGVGERLRDCIKNQSLFDPCLLAIVRGVHAIENNKEQALWLQSLQDVAGVFVLIIADSAPPSTLSFLLQKPTVCDEFKLLDGFELKQFVEAEAAARGARLSALELAELYALYRNDMWGLMTELDTRALSSNPPLPPSSFQLRRDFFSLAKTLAYGRMNEKLSALEELLSCEDPPKIFNMLAALVSGEKKAPLADYDVAVKSGALDYETALLDFAIR